MLVIIMIIELPLRLTRAAPAVSHSVGIDNDPFAVLDPQNWINPYDMTWDEYVAIPNTNWSDPNIVGSVQNFQIALVAVDYSDKPFAITLQPGSNVFGNPQDVDGAFGIPREDIPAWYRDFLNVPSDLNHGHTIHEYWMEDSYGQYGVQLTSYGPFIMPSLSWQYGVELDINADACPNNSNCGLDLREDAIPIWRCEVGDETADSFDAIFILSAGEDEATTYQVFGEMKWQTKEDIPDEFGPPNDPGGKNWAQTEVLNWTSWASSSSIWPSESEESTIQTENCGLGTYCHEMGHVLGLNDNYNNPYSVPPQRDYTGPFSIMSKGMGNGPASPYSRWKIPAQNGEAMGSLHTVRDKAELGFIIDKSSILQLSRSELFFSGLIVAWVQARAVSPGEKLIALEISMDEDLSPPCSIDTDPFCDGGGYTSYYVEVIDRMGFDSFQPDSGVMISKTKQGNENDPYQWVIDANPQGINLLNFIKPDGTPEYIPIGDYRQLLDALFHAGTRSGSQYEYEDEANMLHFYILDVMRDDRGILAYQVGVRALSTVGKGLYDAGASLSQGTVLSGSSTGPGVFCLFELFNTGSSSVNSSRDGLSESPFPAPKIIDFLGTEVFRLEAKVSGAGWTVELPNALAAVPIGESATVKLGVAADAYSSDESAVVTLIATAESDQSVVTSNVCVIGRSMS